MNGYEPLVFKENEILLLDQRKLPKQVEYFSAKTVEDVCFAIKSMVVRGAPLIGITASFGVYLGVLSSKDRKEFDKNLSYAVECLSKTRPTAVNLFFALKSISESVFNKIAVSDAIEAVKNRAFEIWEKQKESDIRIGQNGAEFLRGRKRILTHCNTGTLATGGIGTALGVIKTLAKNNYIDIVYADETRPFLQGLRLTAFELQNENINYKIVTDSSCGILMKKGLIDAVIVGADRIARNGDTANKIGTYCLAVMAKRHNIPFVVAAPESTIDRNVESMDKIVVEERDEKEVLHFAGEPVAMDGARALNYSFDLTDNELISAIITEKGIYERFDF